MSLIIYTSKSQLPKNLKIVDYNDLFFEGVLLGADSLSETVLEVVDLVKEYKDKSFIGRDIDLGFLNKSYLSTGCKTLLNIISSPELCFDVCECGSNALQLLTLFCKGSILWEHPVVNYVYSDTCDIVIDGKAFLNADDFISYIAEVY